MKYKKYPSYKDSGVEWLGEVPEHWELSKVSYNFTAKKGIKASLYTKEYCGEIIGEYPVYSGQTENNGVLARINEFEFDSGMEGYLFSTTVGAKAMTLSHLRGKFSLSQNCMIIKPLKDTNIINTRFYFYHKQPLFKFERGLIPEHMQASFRMEDLYQYKICLPQIQEQQQIANFLDKATAKIDTLIEKQTKQIELLKEKRQSVISHAVSKGINSNVPMKDSGVEWLGEIPEHWEVTKLKFVLQLLNKKEKIINQIVVALENIESWSGKYIESDSNYQGDDVAFCIGDILFGKLRPYLAKVFLCSFDGIAFGDLLAYRPIKDYASKYAFYSLISEDFIKIVDSSTYGTKMPRASSEFLSEMRLTVPPLNEQQQIANYLDDKTSKIDTLIEKSKKSIELLKEKRTALISACVTGKIDVRELV